MDPTTFMRQAKRHGVNLEDFGFVKKKPMAKNEADFMQLLESQLVDDDYFLTIGAMAKAFEMDPTTFMRQAKRYGVNLEDFGLVRKKPRAKKPKAKKPKAKKPRSEATPEDRKSGRCLLDDNQHEALQSTIQFLKQVDLSTINFANYIHDMMALRILLTTM